MTEAEDLRARRAAAFAHIRQWGDAVLRSPARAVDRFDDVLRRQADDMLRVMDDAGGTGLAAPQIGVTNRVLVYRVGDQDEARTLVNPVIEHASEETVLGLEGCLSLGSARVYVAVERARSVVVTAQEVDGAPVRIEADERHARILQHEIDHLDGVLMLDRTDPDQRREAVKALHRGEAWAPPWPEDDEEGDAPDADG